MARLNQYFDRIADTVRVLADLTPPPARPRFIADRRFSGGSLFITIRVILLRPSAVSREYYNK